ncbi:MAG: synthase subcomplex delta subunit [Marmoricola sp.]|jgi:F-type H+-transporting ATPase subunit delta|nr:synthase subcomplex delta subunit [Marmoricola sp.]
MSTSDLRGASAEALEALSEKLRAVSGADAAELGNDLLGVGALLRSEPGLRRIATDLSTDAAAKSGLFRQILEGKVSALALDLVTDAVERRWTRTRDLADALEYLGVVAVVNSADDQERLSDELFAVGELIDSQPDLRTALSDPARSQADKARLLRALLDGKTLPATLRLAEQALNSSHRSVTVAIEEYQKIAAEAHGQSVAEVRAARQPSHAQIERLEAALRNQYGRTVHLNVVIDPDIVGGMRVEIGDDVIDGTVSGRLDEARRRLAG